MFQRVIAGFSYEVISCKQVSTPLHFCQVILLLIYLAQVCNSITELTQFTRTAKSHGQYHKLRSGEVTEPTQGFMAQVRDSVNWVYDDGSIRATQLQIY